MDNTKEKELSNPFSTGGGGAAFETRVLSYFVLSLLLEKSGPVFPNTVIDKIAFQTRHLGFHLDDIVIWLSDSNKCPHRVLCQIKHELDFTKSSAAFQESLNAAWHDFNNPDSFNSDLDAIAFICNSLSKTDKVSIKVLFDWARSSDTSSDFFSRISKPKYSSKAKIEKLGIIREIIEANGDKVSDNQLWAFLKCSYILTYDLDSINSPLFINLNDNAKGSFGDIVTYVQDLDANAATIIRSSIPSHIVDKLQPFQCGAVHRDVERLLEISVGTMRSMRDSIDGIHIHRNLPLLDIYESLPDHDIILVSGTRGSGKSVIVKSIYSSCSNAFKVAVRAEQLDGKSLLHILADAGLASNITDLAGYFSLYEYKILIIESLEKVLEFSDTSAFIALLDAAKRSGWKIVASVREYAVQRLIFEYISGGLLYFLVDVNDFTDEDLEIIGSKSHELNRLVHHPALRELIRNPFILDVCNRAMKMGCILDENNSTKSLHQQIWATIVCNAKDRREGLQLEREQTFIEICLQRARAMRFSIDSQPFKKATLTLLEADELINVDNLGLISVCHDVWEDWALSKYIDKLFEQYKGNPQIFFEKLGMEPAMNRAFRIWFSETLLIDVEVNEQIIDFIKLVFSANVSKVWIDETFASLVQADSFAQYLAQLKSLLLEKENQSLLELCFVIRISVKRPDPLFSLGDSRIGAILPNFDLVLKPSGTSWGIMLAFLVDNFSVLSSQNMLNILGFVSDWSSRINVYDQLPDCSREAGLLALRLLDSLSFGYVDKETQQRLFCVIVKTYPSIKDEVLSLLRGTETSRNIKGVANGLKRYIVYDSDSVFMAKYDPDLLVELIYEVVKYIPDKTDRHWSNMLDIDEMYGFDTQYERLFLFPNPCSFPFWGLFQFAPVAALKLCVDLCNYAIKMYLEYLVEHGEATKEQIDSCYLELTLHEDARVRMFSNADLWCAYRGMGSTPKILQSVLMVFEDWFIRQIEADVKTKQRTAKYVFDYVLKNSTSVLPVSVLASIAVGFPNDVGNLALPLMQSAELFMFDFERAAREKWQLAFNRLPPYDPMSTVINPKIDKSNAYEWRSRSLESLCLSLQITECRQQIWDNIDRIVNENERNTHWQFTRNRIDLRRFTCEPSSEPGQLILKSGELPEELTKIRKEQARIANLQNRFLSISMWAHSGWDEGKTMSCDFPQKADELHALYSISMNPLYESDIKPILLNMFPKAIAVLIRDGYCELTSDQQQWCTAFVVQLMKKEASIIDYFVSDDRIDNTGVDICAYTLCLLLNKHPEEYTQQELIRLIVVAMTHPRLTVLKSVANGIRQIVWREDPRLAKQLVLSYLQFSNIKKENETLWTKFNHYRESDKSETAYSRWLRKARANFIVNESIQGFSQSAVNELLPFDVFLLLKMCASHADAELRPLITLLLMRWISFEQLSNQGDRKLSQQYAHLISEFPKAFAQYVYDASFCNDDYFMTIGEACNASPRFVEIFLIQVEMLNQNDANMTLYWSIWSKLSSEISKIALEICKKRNEEADPRTELIRYFVHQGLSWTKDDYERREIRYGKEHILQFASIAVSNATVFEGIVELMFHYPDIFMNEGLLVISSIKNADLLRVLRASRSTVFCLSRVIHCFITTHTERTINRQHYQACLAILDGLVEAGSSEAYYSRDYLLRSKRER